MSRVNLHDINRIHDKIICEMRNCLNLQNLVGHSPKILCLNITNCRIIAYVIYLNVRGWSTPAS